MATQLAEAMPLSFQTEHRSSIATRILILSDTHGATPDTAGLEADVAIHCGDLTDKSYLTEFRSALSLLRSIAAPIKLVIAGNHDFALDDTVLASKVSDLTRSHPNDNSLPALIKSTFGDPGEARQLFESTRTDGIMFLDEGNHRIALPNGTTLTVSKR